MHLLTAYAPEVAAVVRQLPVDGKTNEHKAALELLGVLPLAGKVVTADAMFTHRDVCTAIRDGGGDYLLPVKDNQPRLRADIEAAFAPPARLSPAAAASGFTGTADRSYCFLGSLATRRGDREAEGAALEMPCTGQTVPRVRIPPSPLKYNGRHVLGRVARSHLRDCLIPDFVRLTVLASTS